MGVYEAIAWSSRSLGQSVSLVKAFLIVKANLNRANVTELMNFLCDLGFSTIEKVLPAPTCTREALINWVP